MIELHRPPQYRVPFKYVSVVIFIFLDSSNQQTLIKNIVTTGFKPVSNNLRCMILLNDMI